VDTDAAIEALAPKMKQLMQQELKLEKGYIGFAKWKLDQELKELEADEANLDDILKEEIEELKKELKEAAEENQD
jgi:cytochrome b involved in lipid metabolism